MRLWCSFSNTKLCGKAATLSEEMTTLPKNVSVHIYEQCYSKTRRGCIVNMKSCYKAAVYLQIKSWRCFNVVSFWRMLKKKYRSYVELITQGVNSEATSILCQVTQGIRHVKSTSTDLIYTKKKQEVVQLGVSVHIPYIMFHLKQMDSFFLMHVCGTAVSRQGITCPVILALDDTRIHEFGIPYR